MTCGILTYVVVLSPLMGNGLAPDDWDIFRDPGSRVNPDVTFGPSEGDVDPSSRTIFILLYSNHSDSEICKWFEYSSRRLESN